VTTGSYVNFPYNELPDYLEEYYGSHVGRLKEIKEKYDPFNIFTFPQGIGSKDLQLSATALGNDKDEVAVKRSDDAYYRGFRYVTSKTHSGISP
jgi:hypothetical protein